MLNLPEIVIILLIVFIVFGMGKLGSLGSQLGKASKNLKDGLSGPDDAKDVIDITPEPASADPSWDPKPGARPQPVEDADIEDPVNS